MPLNIPKIRALMGDKSQAELAALAGMTQPVFSRLLSGRIDPRIATVEKLARALGCRGRDLIL